MKRIAVIALALCVSGCLPERSVETVILMRKGQFRTSDVKKVGEWCWAAWYKTIDKILMRGDLTAVDGPWTYRWTLHRAGPDDPTADRIWFKQNCAEPPKDATP